MTEPERPPLPILPCDRCFEVRYVHPHRPGEFLCRACLTAAVFYDHHERTRR